MVETVVSNVPWHCLLRGTSWSIQIQINHRTYAGWYGIFSRTLTRMPMYVTRPRYCRDLPHRVTPPRQPLRHQVLSLRNYHIQNGQVYGIPQAIRAARIGGFDLMILTETNITDQAYCRNKMEYNVVLS